MIFEVFYFRDAESERRSEMDLKYEEHYRSDSEDEI